MSLTHRLQISASSLQTDEATALLTSLLISTLTDTSVTESIRPHLFGLLALPGASYPPKSSHIPKAAASIIKRVASACLSRSLVYYLSDRKVVRHMVEDFKDLSSSSPPASSTPPASATLRGADAEEEGLWLAALDPLVTLIVCSSRHDEGLKLLSDFDAAGGYEVLSSALKGSSEKNAQGSLELLATLVSLGGERGEAKNERALEVLAGLAGEVQEGLKGSTCFDRALAASRKAMEGRGAAVPKSEAFWCEVLILTLQLFSGHQGNYVTIEPKHKILEKVRIRNEAQGQ